MRKAALVLAAVMAVTAPSMAFAAKKGKKAKAKPAASAAFKPAAATDNSKFFRDAADQWFVPFRSMTGANVGMNSQPAMATSSKKMKRAGKKSKKKAA